MNLSQEEFAAALRAAGAASGEPNDATKRLVQRWESGVSASARPIYRRALQAVTGLTYPELGFADTRRSRPESCDLAHLDADIVGGSIGESIGRSIGAEREMGFPEPGERVGARFLAWVSARTERYRKLDDFLGGADTVDLYCDDVRRTARVLRQGRYSEEVGRELARIVAQQAQQAGWAAFDTGAHAQAQWLFEYSLDAAREAEDQALAGNALALQGYLRNQTGRVGWTIATTAYEVAGPRAPAAARALLAQRLGWAHAVAGQATAAERALDLARGHLLERETQPVPDWAAWADEREQRIIEGRCWVELGRPERAVDVLEVALAEYGTERVRNKALFLTWLALAYLDAQQLEAAAATTMRVCEMAAHIASPRLAHRLSSLTRRFEPYSDLPLVAELLERRREMSEYPLSAAFVREEPSIPPQPSLSHFSHGISADVSWTR